MKSSKLALVGKMLVLSGALGLGALILRGNHAKSNISVSDSETESQQEVVGGLTTSPLTKENFESIVNESVQKYGAYVDSIKISNTTQYTWIQTYSGSPNNLNIDSSLKNTDDLFSFIGSSKLKKPDLEVVIPLNADEINKCDKNGKTKIYFVKRVGERETTSYRCESPLGILFGDSIRDIIFNGKYMMKKHFEWSEDGVKINTEENFILISEHQDELQEVSSLPMEVLHKAIEKYTVRNTQTQINKDYSSLKHDDEVVSSIVHTNNFYEEGLVHAIGILWLKKNKDCFRIKDEDINKELKTLGQHPNYALIPAYLEKISKFGLETVLESYFSNEFPNVIK